MSVTKNIHLRRVPQVFCPSTVPSKPPAYAVESGLQVRRKNDPFSPQARWGDDGARQVQTTRPSARSTSPPRVARQIPIGSGNTPLSYSSSPQIASSSNLDYCTHIQ